MGLSPVMEYLQMSVNALLRLAVLAVMGLVHFFLEKGLVFIIPGNMLQATLFLQDILFVFFLIVYVYLLLVMLEIFIPQFHAKKYPWGAAKKITLADTVSTSERMEGKALDGQTTGFSRSKS